MHVHVLDVGLTRKSIVTVLVYIMNNVIIICMNNLNSNSFIVILFKSNIRYISIEYSTYAISTSRSICNSISYSEYSGTR